MKRSFAITSLAILAVQLSLTGCERVNTLPSGTNYYCDNKSEPPRTIARTTRGDMPIINWKSEYFSRSGWTPEKRCLEVSDRFQSFYRQGLLKHLKTDSMNENPVICTSRTENGACDGVLITLERTDDPKKVLQDITDPNILSIDRGGSGNSFELIDELKSK